jgi:hypothetical protein
VQERFTAVPVATGSAIPFIPPCEDDLYIAGRQCIDFVWSPANDTTARVSGRSPGSRQCTLRGAPGGGGRGGGVPHRTEGATGVPLWLFLYEAASSA